MSNKTNARPYKDKGAAAAGRAWWGKPVERSGWQRVDDRGKQLSVYEKTIDGETYRCSGVQTDKTEKGWSYSATYVVMHLSTRIGAVCFATVHSLAEARDAVLSRHPRIARKG